jgi:hypothetical protein
MALEASGFDTIRIRVTGIAQQDLRVQSPVYTPRCCERPCSCIATWPEKVPSRYRRCFAPGNRLGRPTQRMASAPTRSCSSIRAERWSRPSTSTILSAKVQKSTPHSTRLGTRRPDFGTGMHKIGHGYSSQDYRNVCVSGQGRQRWGGGLGW